jgi:DNA-binding transcriptional LysR family regulator
MIVHCREQFRGAVEPIADAAVFVRVVDAGGFTAAAQALGLSKGAVSKYVGRLEARLGTRLLHRTTRRLSLTEAGERFYRRAQAALAELADAELEAAEHGATPRGHLRVSAPTFYGAEILGRRLREFRSRYPAISLELVLDNRLVNLVEERFDVAVRLSAPRDSSLVMRRLAEIPVVACASPGYLERHGRPVAPADLASHECLLYLLSPRPREWTFLDAGGAPYGVEVQGSFATNDDHTLRRAALDGHGILRMPKIFVQAALERGELVQLWPDDACRKVTLAAVYPSRQALPRKVRAFVDFVAEIARDGSRRARNAAADAGGS